MFELKGSGKWKKYRYDHIPWLCCMFVLYGTQSGKCAGTLILHAANLMLNTSVCS